jgi:type VII secretion effector (TIGR04197 family)
MNLEVVKSDSAVAGKIATAIASSLDGATNGGAILTDTQTTVAGNTNAQEAIQAMLNGQNKIVQAIGKASSNLQSVTHEFEAADQATRQLMSAISIPSPTEGK